MADVTIFLDNDDQVEAGLLSVAPSVGPVVQVIRLRFKEYPGSEMISIQMPNRKALEMADRFEHLVAQIRSTVASPEEVAA